MEKDTLSTRVPALSVTAARAAVASAAATLALLALLHLLSPEFNPARRMVSEYALGRYGWLLSLMFLTWALSSAALSLALRPHARTAGGRVGLALLLVAALGMALAAIFDIRQGLHGLATLLGNLPFVAAAVLVSTRLARAEPGHPGRRSLLWSANLPWLSLALMVGAVLIGVASNGGQFGAEMPIGWPNRLLVLAYCAWTIIAARWTVTAERPTS